MKRFLFFFTITAMSLFSVSAARAQSLNHVELGVFGEYVRLGAAGNAGFGGLGARLGANISTNVQLEAELSYDFQRTFTESFTNGTGGGVGFSTQQSHLRILTGMFGPKIQTGGGPFRAFLTVKGGALNFGITSANPGAGFTSSLSTIRASNVDAVLYPGGGIEAFLGPVGLRLDIGDLIYFTNGGHNNLRIAFGPQLRF